MMSRRLQEVIGLGTKGPPAPQEPRGSWHFYTTAQLYAAGSTSFLRIGRALPQ
jgi:hypothetical protein